MRVQIQAVAIYDYFLVLNPMMGNTENCQEFGPFDTREAALAHYNAELAEPYQDQGPNMFGSGEKTYHKSFRKGGPMEWCNKLHETEIEHPGCFGHGIHEVLVRLENIQRLGPA